MPVLRTKRNQVAELVNQGIAQRLFPGCAVGVVKIEPGDRRGQRPAFFTYVAGHTHYSLPSPLVSIETLYDVASLTKSVVTNSLAMWLVSAGKLHLTDHVTTYVPDLSWQSNQPVTIHHLLTYSVDVQLQLSQLKDLPADEIMAAVLSAPLGVEPGQSYHYINATSIVLGLVVERVSGKRLDQLATEVFFEPLGMRQTGFRMPELQVRSTRTKSTILAPAAVVAPTEIDSWRGRVIQGEVHDESSWTLQQAGRVSGAAGLFTSLSDLLLWETMLLSPAWRREFFSDEAVRAWSSPQLSLPVPVGLGWELNAPWMGVAGRQLIGKTGFTGCCLMMDMERQLGLVVLNNHTYPRRPQSREAITRFRQAVGRLVFG